MHDPEEVVCHCSPRDASVEAAGLTRKREEQYGRISSFGTQIQWISPRTEKEQQNKHAFFPYMTSVVAVTMY